jgi:hypothetical protein
MLKGLPDHDNHEKLFQILDTTPPSSALLLACPQASRVRSDPASDAVSTALLH